MIGRGAKSLDTTAWAAHEFYEAILANMYDLAYSASEPVPFGDRSYVTFWHSERIESSFTTGGYELTLKVIENIQMAFANEPTIIHFV